MSVLAIGFLNAALLWALPLAALPVVIHLLNRRRFQRVRWAAMDFLLSAMRRNRRRLQMEQWLVLLLRTLAVVALVLLVARPHVEGSLLGDERVHHVVVLDDSASMAQQRASGDVFSGAREHVRELGDHLAAEREGDLLTLVRTSLPNRPELAATRVGSAFPSRLREVLDGLAVTDGRADLRGALDQAQRRIEDAGGVASEVHLIGDVRMADWLAAGGGLQSDLDEVLRELPARRIAVVDVAPDDEENVGVVSVRTETRLPAVGVPVELVVEVRNHGDRAVDAEDLALEVDGRSRVVRRLEPLAAGERRAVDFTHTFRRPGSHAVVASLPADRFRPDDRRAFALEVVPAARALLVDGEPGGDGEPGETVFLAAALEHEESGVAVEVLPDHMLGEVQLEEYDVVWLCNVPAPAPDAVTALERYVASGGGLVVFSGDQVDPRRYAAAFGRGGGLLPAVPAGLAGDLDRPAPVHLARSTHPAFAVATDVLGEMFDRWVRVGRWLAVEPTGEHAVLLRVEDSRGAPLMLQRGFGAGSVVLVTTTADLEWTSWPKTPAWLIVVQRLQHALSRAGDQERWNLDPGGVLRIELDPSRHRPDVVVAPLEDPADERTFTAEPVPAGEDGRPRSAVEVPMSRLQGTGVFALRLRGHGGGTETRLFTRGVPPSEGRLQKVGAAEWRRTMPEELRQRVVLERAGAAASAREVSGGEAWRALGLGLLGVLLLESFLAARFGRR